MQLRFLALVCVLGLVALLPALRAPATSAPESAPAAAEPVPLHARVEGDRLLLDTPRGTSTFLAGVNLGVTVPGHQPGELAVGRDDYRRWFARMHEYGIQVVRVYTLQAPTFYRELRRHNLAHPKAPIGVLHGVWIPEGPFYETRDLYDPATAGGFEREITRAVKAVHGATTVAPRPGHASGRYSADISPWLLGWVIGVEWDPEIVRGSDRANADVDVHRGRWFRARPRATPTESWLARMLDHTADVQQAHGRQVPVSFVNWVTTDPLDHPEEPIGLEDIVSIDPNHIAPTARWRGGYFASYHAYPYYPDFLRHEPGLRGPDGDGDPYTGYLRSLRRHHEGLPVLVAEFGVPSGPGIAHLGARGRDQGDHSEQEAMRQNADMLRAIHDAGMAGGLVFEWIDEWFKFTWNTIEQELPAERRALWFNPWTNESQFGLLASRPGAKQPPITIDADDREWDRSTASVIYSGTGDVREVLATHDEGYLYLLVTVADRNVWRRSGVTVGFDVLDGGARLPGGPRRHREADNALRIGPGRRARLTTRASNNPYLIQFGVVRDYVAGVSKTDIAPGSDRWDVQRLILNRPILIPSTGVYHGAEHFDIGALRHGPTAADGRRFDARNMWMAKGRTIELRLPWAGVGLSDPSSRRALHVDSDGNLRDVATDGVAVSVLVDGDLRQGARYTWPTWDQPTWHERPKKGLSAFTDALAEFTQPRHRRADP